MKTKFALIAMLALLIFSCSDDESAYKCSSCSSTPDANATNDASGLGIYKGMVVGSSGTIIFNLDNDDDGSYTAVLTIDGDSYELESESVYNGETGFSGIFYGTMNTTDDITIKLVVNYNGSSFYIDYDNTSIPGHSNIEILIFKEYSDALVQVYEGTYKGSSTGTFNMVVQEDEDYWYVNAKTSDGIESFDGYFDGDELICDCSDPSITGKISGDQASGTWQSVAGEESGTWSGKRTL